MKLIKKVSQTILKYVRIIPEVFIMEETVKKIPPSSKRRFPLYLRALSQLHQRGVVRVMSYQIGNMCNISADTVRRDLMYVKHKGKTAAGYEVESLFAAFNEELGTNTN